MIYYILALILLLLLLVLYVFSKKKREVKEPYSYEFVEKNFIEEDDRIELLKEAIKLYKNKHKEF